MRKTTEILDELVGSILEKFDIEVCAYDGPGNLIDEVDDLNIRLDAAVDHHSIGRTVSLKSMLTAYSEDSQDTELLRAMKRLRAVGEHALMLAKRHEQTAMEVGLL